MDDFELFKKLAMCGDKEQMARVIEEHNNAKKPTTNADCTGLCKTCLHTAVCAKRAATGGNVQNCQHHAEERHGRWLEKVDMVESYLSDCTEVFYECSVCESASPGESPHCPHCGAKMDLEG